MTAAEDFDRRLGEMALGELKQFLHRVLDPDPEFLRLVVEEQTRHRRWATYSGARARRRLR